MAYGKLVRTQYLGVYIYKDNLRRKAFAGRYRADSKTYYKIIGYEGDRYGMTETSVHYKRGTGGGE
ncbi:MAG: hypothetical protein LBI57_05465 [Helicobacteraceae bacterium]|nr:hypothetical protein [Helicobacteraceae bacterium]